MAFALRTPVGLRAPAMAPARSRAATNVICKAQAEEQTFTSKLAMPLATIALSTMISGAMMMSPEEALAARSSGRVGGSSGFKSRSMEAPSRSSTTARSTVTNNTVVMAPPVMAPPLFGGFGYGGFSIMPSFVMPFPFFGGMFQFFFLMMIVSVVFSVIRGFMSSGDGGSNKSNKKGDDGWGDL